MEACDGSLENLCKGSPSAEGAVVSHEAVYTRVLYPLPASRIWPVTGVMPVLEAHQTQAASTWWGSAPTQFVGMVSTG